MLALLAFIAVIKGGIGTSPLSAFTFGAELRCRSIVPFPSPLPDDDFVRYLPIQSPVYWFQRVGSICNGRQRKHCRQAQAFAQRIVKYASLSLGKKR